MECVKEKGNGRKRYTWAYYIISRGPFAVRPPTLETGPLSGFPSSGRAWRPYFPPFPFPQAPRKEKLDKP